MSQENKGICELVVLGYNATGKSTLIEKLTRQDNRIVRNQGGYDTVDWVVEEGEYLVNVQVKERRNTRGLGTRSHRRGARIVAYKAIVVIVVNASLGLNFHNVLESSINEYSTRISEEYPILVLFNTPERGVFNNVDYHKLRLRYPHIREFLEYDFFKEELADLRFLLRNMIINLSTDRLDYARNLISTNLSNQESSLDIGGCALTSLYEVPEIFKCVHLEELVISNEWAKSKNGRWYKQESQNPIGRNSIGEFPIEIKTLKNLKRIVAGGDWNRKGEFWNRFRVYNMSPLLELRNLEYINLSNNRVQLLSSLTKLKKLNVLHLNNNEISRTKSRSQSVQLAELYLSNNLLKSVKFIKYFPELKTLDFHGNKIKDLRPLKSLIEKIGITNTKWELNTVNIAQNPLDQPPMEIVNIGTKAVLNYFEDTSDGELFLNKDVKLILVGNSEVGKTTLSKYLNSKIDFEKEHLPTLWMQEIRLKSKQIIDKIKAKCNINLFDFGGHDYYHDTHHLFFGKNAIYLVLWDGETNGLNFRITEQKDENNVINKVETQDFPLKYWLDSITYFIQEKESQSFEFDLEKKAEYNGRALVIQNKVSSGEEIVHLNAEKIVSEYSFIYDFANISLRPERNLEHLDNLITETLNNMEIVGAKIPKYYEIIKSSIKSYGGEPILTLSEFRSYCIKLLKKRITYERTSHLASYLEQIGEVLYFPQSGSNDKIYINKKWVLSVIHKILRGVKKKDGEFDVTYVKQVLGKQFNRSKIDSVMKLMIEFKIVFLHPESNRFIAPLYLPKQPNQAVKLFIESTKIAYRKFHYTGFIHKNVILNFYQEYGRYVLKEGQSAGSELYYYWKDGLVIKDPKSNEIVMIRFHLGDTDGNASIDIIKMNNINRTDFVDTIIEFIKIINHGYEIEELITLDGVNFVPLSIIHGNEEEGNFMFQYKDKYFKLSNFKKHLKSPTKMKNIFISYSKQDLVYVNKFVEHLSALQEDGRVAHWYCTELKAGGEWDQDIQDRFDKADIVCFMISPSFMKTQYIRDHEIAEAFKKKEKNPDFKIVPIILDFCRWTTKKNNLGQYTALPYTAKPVADFENQNMAWYLIEECLRLIIDEDIDPQGNEYYRSQKLPSDVLRLYERIISGKADR